MNLIFFVAGCFAGTVVSGALIFIGFRIGRRRGSWTIHLPSTPDDSEASRTLREKFFSDGIASGWGTRGRQGDM